MNGLLLSGDIFIDRLSDTGVSQGKIGPINVTQLAINTPSEQITRTSKKKATYGQALDSVSIAQPATVTIAIDDQPADVLAMALLGDIATVNEGSGNVTDEAVTILPNGRWTQLAHKNLAAAGISAKLASDESAIMADNYEINYALGLIRATAGGSLEAGADIELTYQHNAVTGTKVKGGIKSQIRMNITGDMKNLATGKPGRLEIFEATVAPTDAVDFMASEFVSTTLSGNCKLVSGKDSPFEYTDITPSE
ncbi:hypothetical protein [Catenovulum sediminis]|uniref:phage tail tube protein n=1 Tax=Catenovulum sediminis TaxID=1740262 RepID=UPI00118043E8|nr:hypothetical protein [Catenovulum sediminis]